MSDSAYDDSELILPKAKSSTQSYTLDLLADCLDSVHRSAALSCCQPTYLPTCLLFYLPTTHGRPSINS